MSISLRLILTLDTDKFCGNNISHRLIKIFMENEFENFTWRSKLYLNSQIIIKLLSYLTKYIQKEVQLYKVFQFVEYLNKKFSNELYPEVKNQINELAKLEEEIKTGAIYPKRDEHIIKYVVNTILWHFTGEGL